MTLRSETFRQATVALERVRTASAEADADAKRQVRMEKTGVCAAYVEQA